MNKMTIVPVATEKAYGESLRTNTYIFTVPLNANKQQIIDAVEKQFSVNVEGIKTLVQAGKAKRYNRGRNRYPGETVRSDVKKAYVKLRAGDKLDIFDNETQEEKK